MWRFLTEHQSLSFFQVKLLLSFKPFRRKKADNLFWRPCFKLMTKTPNVFGQSWNMSIRWPRTPLRKGLCVKGLAIVVERVLAASHGHFIDLLAAQRINQCHNVEITYQLDQFLSSFSFLAKPTKSALKCVVRTSQEDTWKEPDMMRTVTQIRRVPPHPKRG